MKDIANIVVLKSDAILDPEKARELFEEHDYDLPEECWLRNFVEYLDSSDEEEKFCEPCDLNLDDDSKFCKNCGQAVESSDTDDDKIGFDLLWVGEDSGSSFQSIFVKQIVPHIKGRVEALLFLEGPADQPYKLMGIVVDNGTYKSYDATVQFNPWPARSSQEDDS